MAVNKVDSDRLRGRIRDHFLTHGHKRWDEFERPAAISYSMFARYKREVRDRLIEDGLLEPKKQQAPLATSEDHLRVKEIAKAADLDETAIAKPINLMSQIDRMLGICDMLDKDATENGKLKDSADAREALKARVSVLKLAVDGQDTLYGTHRIMQVHNVMMHRIAKADPEMAKSILADLKAVDREYGLGLN